MGLAPAPESALRIQRERIEDYAIIDTPREAAFDRVVFTAAQVFRVPVATIGLVQDNRHWFKAQVGLAVAELPRHLTFCEQLLAANAVVVVEDATRDERFADNPLVTGPPFLRFYAGAPLRTPEGQALGTPDGIRVGSICIGDRFAKTLSSRQSWQLGQFAATTVGLLEERRKRS